MALSRDNWKLVVKKKYFTSSSFKKLNIAVDDYLNSNNLQGLKDAWFNWKIALGKKKPPKTFKTSDRYTTTLDEIEDICNPPTTPPFSAKTSTRPPSASPQIMGAPHPIYSKQDRDETISHSGHTYRTYRQMKEASCGPTCCLIVLKNYYAQTHYDEASIRGEMMRIRVGGYKPYTGTNMVPLKDYLLSKIGRSGFYENCSLDNLRTATTRTNTQLYPGIIRIEWYGGTGAHFVVVVETLPNNTFMVLDPLKNYAQELKGRDLLDYHGRGSWDYRIVTSY